MQLTGLDRLLETCRTHHLTVRLEPPSPHALAAGTLIGGHPFDPVLAAVYARVGKAVFAPETAGMGLLHVGELAERNRAFQEYPQPQLALPLFEFGGVPGLAYSFATVPGLADERGHQPVVQVNSYDAPSALAVASDVDRFFNAFAAYLEALRAHPEFHLEEPAPLLFPWDVPEVLARDERLVALLRSGRFAPLLTHNELHDWAASLLRLADSAPQLP